MVLTELDNLLKNAGIKVFVTEDRDASLDYKEKEVKGVLDKVLVELSHQQSSAYTVLAQKYKQLDEQAKELKIARDELNDVVRDKALELFDAEDEIMTRVVETASMTINISKRTTVTTQRTDYQAMLEALIEQIGDRVPELTQMMEGLEKTYTTITQKEKKPALRVKVKEEESNSYIADISAKVSHYVDRFTAGFDSKLDSIKYILDRA
jgi:predicted hydrocarbon binding protein